MGNDDCSQVEMASFRVAEFSDVLDWRPMQFLEPIIAQRACVLCGVVYKKAVRLPCMHTLCIKCHAQCVYEGSVCPVDQKPFCEDDVEKLEVSVKFILKRKVACWNAPRGCSFIGSAASLLDHYKECDFSFMSCCLCRSPVLQRNILEHFKDGCSIHRASSEPAGEHATQELELETKKATTKISEDLISLKNSLSRSSEDVRAEGARWKDQWEAEASRLVGQLNDLNTVCTTGFAEELLVLQGEIADHQEHLSEELRSRLDKLTVVFNEVSQSLLSHCRPKMVHWYIECWVDLKNNALEGSCQSLNSPTRSMYDYCVSQCVTLELVYNEVRFGCFIRIHSGDKDSQLEWPFCKVYRAGVMHPMEQSNVICYDADPGKMEDQLDYQRPKGQTNRARGKRRLSTADELERRGFIQNNTLHVFLEMWP